MEPGKPAISIVENDDERMPRLPIFQGPAGRFDGNEVSHIKPSEWVGVLGLDAVTLADATDEQYQAERAVSSA